MKAMLRDTYKFRMQHVLYDGQQFAPVKLASYKTVHQFKKMGIMLLFNSLQDKN